MRWIAILLACGVLSGCAGMAVTARISVEETSPSSWAAPAKGQATLEITRRLE